MSFLDMEICVLFHHENVVADTCIAVTELSVIPSRCVVPGAFKLAASAVRCVNWLLVTNQ